MNPLAEIIESLSEKGAIKDKRHNGDQGYRLKLHEAHPEKPLSPFFFNLRTPENPKPGPLTPGLVRRIAELMFWHTKQDDLGYQYVAGLPNAGTPFAEAFVEGAREFSSSNKLIHLGKQTSENSRKILGVIEKVPPGKVLLLDDLITEATSKIEAVDALHEQGFEVTDIVVFLDRMQGGVKEMASRGITVHSLVTVSEVFTTLHDLGLMPIEVYGECMAYLRESSK